MVTEIVITIFLIPLVLFSLWSYFNPEDSMLIFERWKYNEVEFTELAIDIHKFRSIVGMLVIIFVLINLYYMNVILNLILVIAFCIFVAINLHRILSK